MKFEEEEGGSIFCFLSENGIWKLELLLKFYKWFGVKTTFWYFQILWSNVISRIHPEKCINIHGQIVDVWIGLF